MIASVQKAKGRILILGSGWAGFKFLKRINKTQHEISMVSPRNYFVFTPLLASTCVGTLEFRCVTEPVRGHYHDLDFYQATASKIDFQKQQVTVKSMIDGDEFQVEYDKLVVACGAVTNTFGIPGVRENCFFLKDISDARRIRHRIIENFEKAKQPGLDPQKRREYLHFVSVGGGPTGVEFSAELHDFITEDLSKLYPDLMPQVQMSLIDVAPKILTSFDAHLSAYASTTFIRKGIHVRTGTKVKEVKDNGLLLEDGSFLPSHFVVWATGLSPNPLITSLDLPLDPGKRLYTDAHLRVLGKDDQPINNVFALGDCATIKGNILPQTAQVASQKAIYLANLFNRTNVGEQVTKNAPFTFKNLGSLAYIGDWKAIADTPGTKGSGTSAWLFWRSAYLTMSVSLKNKILIPMYWFLAWAFGRDTTRI
ncbi:FAD/NAD-P-binding domain-containing protein [Gorgonomyces haynaldii]|nr:FAD/NAD-P-binding domain-containing protein [Gorgonomyces haynaldii]